MLHWAHMEQTPGDAYEFEHDPLLELQLHPEKLRGIDQELGPRGIGAFVVPAVLTPWQVRYMQEEIFDPFRVAWRDNHDEYVNQRGVTITENHTVFALKLHQGDPSWIRRVPRMRALTYEVEKLANSLSGVFPSLEGWQADEMSLHRYDDPDVGLSFHRDNLRFSGLIAVITLEGASDFAVRHGDSGEEVRFPVGEGDLALTRATGLYPQTDSKGRPVNLCPEHAVLDLKTPHRSSFIVRANTRSHESLPGFTFDNWSPDEV